MVGTLCKRKEEGEIYECNGILRIQHGVGSGLQESGGGTGALDCRERAHAGVRRRQYRIADTVLENGGKVIGIIPDFLLHCEQGHEGLHTLEVVHSMSTRKSRMIELGDAFIAMPGGIGTLEEITEVLTLKRLGRTEKRAFLYNINGYYEPLRGTFRQMVEKEFLPEEEMELFEFVANVDELDEALRG